MVPGFLQEGCHRTAPHSPELFAPSSPYDEGAQGLCGENRDNKTRMGRVSIRHHCALYIRAHAVLSCCLASRRSARRATCHGCQCATYSAPLRWRCATQKKFPSRTHDQCVHCFPPVPFFPVRPLLSFPFSLLFLYSFTHKRTCGHFPRTPHRSTQPYRDQHETTPQRQRAAARNSADTPSSPPPPFNPVSTLLRASCPAVLVSCSPVVVFLSLPVASGMSSLSILSFTARPLSKSATDLLYLLHSHPHLPVPWRNSTCPKGDAAV